MDYEKLLALVNKYKVLGKSPNEIRDLLDAYFEIEGIDKASSIDVPIWDSTGTTKTGSDQVALDKVIDDLVGKEDTPEEKTKKEEAVSKSNAIKEAQHKERMEALPDNQKQSAEEQARITEGYKNEVHPDISEGGKDALYADLDKVKEAGFIRQVENNINRLAGKDNDTDFANKVLAELVSSKNAGKKFTSSLSFKTLQELAKRFSNAKEIKNVLDGLKETYDHETFGRLKASLNMMHSKGNSAESRLAREIERVNETTGTEKGAQEATARSVKPGSIMRREGVTAFDKAFAGGTEADAAKKALAQDVNAYDDKFFWSAIVGNMKKSGKIDKNMTDDEIRQNPELIKQINDQIAAANNKVRQSVSDAQKPTYSVDQWLKYFEKHPDVRFHNQANARTVNNTGLGLTAIYKDDTGKEVMEKLPLFGKDVLNFRDALYQYRQRTGNSPEVKTEFTNLNTKNTDTTEDSPRNQKYVDRFNRFFDSAAGDMKAFSTVFGGPKVTKYYTRDENGFVTEYDRDPKKASGSGLRGADYFNQLAGIMKDPKNAVPNLVGLITDQHGKDAAAKAQNLYNDVNELNSVFGPVITPENVDPSVLRSFAGKFNRLRKTNPNMSLTDILNSGDVSDVFGVKIHPKFTGNDKFSRLDLLKAALKLAKYKKNAAKAGIDFDALRSDLDDNINAYKNSVDTNDFSNLPEGVDAGLAKEALDTLNTIRSYIDTPAEREAKLRGQLVGTPDAGNLKSLADEAPEEFERAEAEYKNAMNEYALAKQNKDTDFDVLNMLRKDVEETRSKMEYLKNTKVDILKRAEELGKPYQEVLDDYLHPDWDEDDMELNIQKMLNEYDLMDELKASAGGNIHNSNVKANAIAEALDKLSGVDPRFEKWRNTLNSWSRPVAASQLMSSADTAKQYLDMTPAEWSAYNTNKGFFDSDVEQKRRNTTLTGQRKSAKGIAGADTVALDKLAKDLQYMDYTDDTAGKQALYNKLQADNKKASDPYTRNLDIDERLANAIRGVLADRPEEN